MRDLTTYPLRLPRSLRAGVERFSNEDAPVPTCPRSTN